MIIDQATLKRIHNNPGHGCFGCGAQNDHGLKMEFFTDDNKIYSFMKTPSYLTGWDKSVHGGILSTILDEIMGWSVLYLVKRIGVTNSMTVDFIKSVKTDEILTVVGEVSHVESNRHAVINGSIFNEKDVLCVKSSGRFTTMKPEAAVRLGIVSGGFVEMFTHFLS